MTKSARGRKARRAEWEAAPGPWSDSEAEMLAATSYVPKKSPGLYFVKYNLTFSKIRVKSSWASP